MPLILLHSEKNAKKYVFKKNIHELFEWKKLHVNKHHYEPFEGTYSSNLKLVSLTVTLELQSSNSQSQDMDCYSQCLSTIVQQHHCR